MKKSISTLLSFVLLAMLCANSSAATVNGKSKISVEQKYNAMLGDETLSGGNFVYDTLTFQTKKDYCYVIWIYNFYDVYFSSNIYLTRNIRYSYGDDISLNFYYLYEDDIDCYFPFASFSTGEINLTVERNKNVNSVEYGVKVTERKLGDPDGDGKITAADARLALRASVLLETDRDDPLFWLAANADHDDEITSADARLILRASVGLENITFG